MLNYFPRYLSKRAIICYFITLLLSSVLYMKHAMPFQFMLFGSVSVVLFFVYSTRLTLNWQNFPKDLFVRKLFFTALLIRLIYVIFVYFYYIEMTGEPHAYHAGDEIFYNFLSSLWHEEGFSAMVDEMRFVELSDSGYPWWVGFNYFLFGTHVLTHRIVKCIMDAFTCLLMYSLAKRNFGESTGRMAAILYMLMPNMWFYCGVTLKETEMSFLTILFLERADLVFRSERIKLKELLVPGVTILLMFTFRTALAAVMIAALVMTMVLSSKQQLQTWKKILYGSVFALWMLLTVGVEIMEETQQMWEGRMTNQTAGYEWRATREGGNSYATYATSTVFAPLIFTMPFSTMVEIPIQENQMMMHGANFIKNVLSGLTILALFLLLIRGDWRKHVLPIAVVCGYLAVLVFSNFAHSERFHFPVLGLELMFAAYGVSQLTNKHKKWYRYWLVGVCVANMVWGWIKLAGRGMV